MLQLIEILTRLLLGWFFFVGVRTTSVDRPSQPPEPVEVTVPAVEEPSDNVIESITTIYEVDVLVLESFPMQVQLHVRGEHADGCELPVLVEQSREGNTVTVKIYRELPADVMCPMVLQPYDDTIMLEGTFEPGDYVFQVNDFVVERTL